MHDITGTTTITSFGTVSAGIHKRLQFDGALQITHNATSLICPSGANITTYAGLCIDLVSLGSGNWIITSQLPGMMLLETKTASGSAQLDFTGLSANYDQYLFTFGSIAAATDGANLQARYSDDGGSTFFATGSYRYIDNVTTSSAPTSLTGSGGSAGDTSILIAPSISNAAGATVSGEARLATTTMCSLTWHVHYFNSSSLSVNGWGGGHRTTSGINAVRFMMSSGNIASGTIRMYGMRK